MSLRSLLVCGCALPLSAAACGDDHGSPAPDAAPIADCTPRSGTTIKLVPIATGLTEPLMLAGAPGDPRMWIIEQSGTIRVIEDGNLLPAPFMDLAGPNGPIWYGGERGLLGIAFHPDFRHNDRFYLHFSHRDDGNHVLAEYRATHGADTADPMTRRDLLNFDDPYENHNAGMIEFGNDGKLYMSLGDGGSGGDPENRAQDDRSLFGKMLRLDVDARTGSKAYGIPSDNPFANSPDGVDDPRPEIWQKGLRNPFRWSFDRETGDVYIGDVGQDTYEEVDVSHNTAMVNYGWNVREARHCYNAATCATAGLLDPVVEWDHPNDGWASVMGGQVYRGGCFPDLRGTYFYGDYFHQRIRAFEWNPQTGAADNDREVYPHDVGHITAIHADSYGELYVVTHDGNISRIEVE